jgi:hypothetical protein
MVPTGSNALAQSARRHIDPSLGQMSTSPTRPPTAPPTLALPSLDLPISPSTPAEPTLHPRRAALRPPLRPASDPLQLAPEAPKAASEAPKG